MSHFQTKSVAEPTYPEIILSGAIAGLLQSPIVTPLELVKIKLQTTTREGGMKGPIDALKTIYRSSGLRGFYQGGLVTAMRCC
jgi:hypothetical protein